MTKAVLIRDAIAYADSHGADGQPLDTAVEGLAVVRQRAPSSLIPVLYEPVFCIVLQGAKQVYLGERAIAFTEDQGVIISIDLPTLSGVVTASREAPYVSLAVALDLGLARELADEIGLTSPADEAGASIATGDSDPSVYDAMERLFRLNERPEAIPIMRPLILREIHYWLLTAPQGALLRTLLHRGSHAERVNRALALLRSDFAHPLSIRQLAEEAGMSQSSFHEHFRAVTGTTPLQYQKRLRLIEARRLMRSESIGVSSAAFAVGYESPTQFSREYRRQFGMSPRYDRVGMSEPVV